MTPAEQATLLFYQFEYLHRGYYHFDSPVYLEPPYTPLNITPKHSPQKYDDGRVPNVLKRIGYFLQPQQKNIIEETPFEITTQDDTRKSDTVIYRLTIPKENNVLTNTHSEFLSLLTATSDVISFEIVGRNTSISVYCTCGTKDSAYVYSQLSAFFPHLEIAKSDEDIFDLDTNRKVAIADFGLENECMFPIKVLESKGNDPLISFIGICEHLNDGETAILQILFQGATTPIARDVLSAVSDGQGNCFFVDCPEMLSEAKSKVSLPLMYVLVRIAAQSTTDHRTRKLVSNITQSIHTISSSSFNSFIPLSNERYEYDQHLYNLYARKSNRFGMLLNTQELATLVHIPQSSIVSSKLFSEPTRTKKFPFEASNEDYLLGINTHNGQDKEVRVSEEEFGKHICIGGATGSGKTYLLKQLVQQSFKRNMATVVIDPHGDLVRDILSTIEDEVTERVVYLNMADEEVAFCLNIFDATSEAEKTVLVSDLAQAFSETWISSGDRIQSVLQKTIATFVYSRKEGSILDMKRFLLEAPFRREFLTALDDPILQYYWNNEFPLVRRNELSPLLLRIDTFMQTRLLQTMFAETKGIDISALIGDKKLVLIQLSVGLIGHSNSVFIAKLLIAKINQVAFARQRFDQHLRHPIHLYIDEAHYYANIPSIESILFGARKYSLSLILVIQNLDQVPPVLLNCLLGNVGTQIFFRQSDKDSKRIASGYSFFDPEDFMELDVGEALVRITKRSGDCNMKTIYEEPILQPPAIANSIIQQSQQQYGTLRSEIHKRLVQMLPHSIQSQKSTFNSLPQPIIPLQEVSNQVLSTETSTDEFLQQKESFLNDTEEKETVQKHRMLQQLVRTMALQRGFKATIEETLGDGSRVDVELIKNDVRIAVEVSITNTNGYEVQNIQKCIEANFTHIFMMSESTIHLKNIRAKCKEVIEKKYQKSIYFFTPNELGDYFEKVLPTAPKQDEIKRVRGYRIKSSQVEISDTRNKEKKKSLKELIQQTFKIKKQ